MVLVLRTDERFQGVVPGRNRSRRTPEEIDRFIVRSVLNHAKDKLLEELPKNCYKMYTFLSSNAKEEETSVGERGWLRVILNFTDRPIWLPLAIHSLRACLLQVRDFIHNFKQTQQPLNMCENPSRRNFIF